jgi:hypothetical protein
VAGLARVRGLGKTSHDKRRGSCFVTHHRGLPLHGYPFVFLPPWILRRASLSRPHPYGKGRGGGGRILASEGAAAVLREPTSLNRGEGLISGLTGEVGGVEGEGGGGGGEMVVEE